MRTCHTCSPVPLPGSASTVHSALPPAIITISHWPPGVSTYVRHACSGSIWRVSGFDGAWRRAPLEVTRSPTCNPVGPVDVPAVVVGSDAAVVVDDDVSLSSLPPHAATTSAMTAPEMTSWVRMR